jgi:hypothetical protein
MTKRRLPRVRDEHSPQPLLDLRLFVLVSVAGLIVWLAIIRPAAATAIALGLSTLYLLHRIVGR